MANINVLKVGITGGIGSGKSTVAKIFSLLGVPVYSADDVSKSLYHTDVQLMADIKKHFGEEVYENDILNRSKLADLVFQTPEKLQLLNSLVHPPTIRHAEAWMKEQNAPYLIKEAALLFESGSVRGLDLVIGVWAPVHLRTRRAMERDGSTREQVQSRMSRQIDEQIKMKLCDFVLVNDEQQLLIPQVLELHEKLMERSKSL